MLTDTMNELEDELASEKSDSIFIKRILSLHDGLPLLDNLASLSFPSNKQFSNADNSSSASKTEKKQLKSGRKRQHPLLEGVKIHDKKTHDNILRRIHVHYISFIINVINELLNYFGFTVTFIDIDYNVKKELNKKKFSLLKNSNIGQILCQKVSPKFRKQSKQNLYKNNYTFHKVKSNKYVNFFLSQNYITLFKDVYLKDKRDINLDDLNFHFSENVKTYANFLSQLEKYEDKEEYEMKINEVIHKYYFKKFFEVEKI